MFFFLNLKCVFYINFLIVSIFIQGEYGSECFENNINFQCDFNYYLKCTKNQCKCMDSFNRSDNQCILYENIRKSIGKSCEANIECFNRLYTIYSII